MTGSLTGSPHSSHSLIVSGIVGSDIVVTQSTNGTSAITARQRCGAIENTAPCSRPPADRPRETIRSGAAQPSAASMSAAAMKSVNVLRLRSSRPCSHQRRPPSPPPRICATAYTAPRSSRLGVATLNSGQ